MFGISERLADDIQIRLADEAGYRAHKAAARAACLADDSQEYLDLEKCLSEAYRAAEDAEAAVRVLQKKAAWLREVDAKAAEDKLLGVEVVVGVLRKKCPKLMAEMPGRDWIKRILAMPNGKAILWERLEQELHRRRNWLRETLPL